MIAVTIQELFVKWNVFASTIIVDEFIPIPFVYEPINNLIIEFYFLRIGKTVPIPIVFIDFKVFGSENRFVGTV